MTNSVDFYSKCWIVVGNLKMMSSGRTQRCARDYQLRASKANTNGQTIPD
ncbi:MAG TPA: hypothetical protein VK568_01115 [Thermodesulfobacteriota bacterium]|nr:hypothetical protein [Thermodesulfobacteriota bacterium]